MGKIALLEVALWVWLAVSSGPYMTYLLREAEIMDKPRSYLLRSNFFADMLDCKQCSSFWGSLLVDFIALLGAVSYYVHPFLSLPALGILVCLAGSSWSVTDGVHNSDTDPADGTCESHPETD